MDGGIREGRRQEVWAKRQSQRQIWQAGRDLQQQIWGHGVLHGTTKYLNKSSLFGLMRRTRRKRRFMSRCHRTGVWHLLIPGDKRPVCASSNMTLITINMLENCSLKLWFYFLFYKGQLKKKKTNGMVEYSEKPQVLFSPLPTWNPSAHSADTGGLENCAINADTCHRNKGGHHLDNCCYNWKAVSNREKQWHQTL